MINEVTKNNQLTKGINSNINTTNARTTKVSTNVSTKGNSTSNSNSNKGKKRKGAGILHILGVPLKLSGRLFDEIKKVYGLNTANVDSRIRSIGLLRSTKVHKLKREEYMILEKIMNERYLVNTDLRRAEYENIQRHRKIGTYKGVRMRAGLPVHGQRTSTNAKTAAKLNKRRCKM